MSLAAGPAQASSWTVEPSPSPYTGSNDGNYLNAVDCVSASSCLAIGSGNVYNGTGYDNPPLALRWDGTSWGLITPSTNAYLTGVSCVSATKCFAFGTGQRVNYRGVPVILRWNGTKWSTVKVPLRANQFDQEIAAVDCPTTTSCLAVGGSSNGPGSPFHTLVYRYNGSSWSIIKSPNPSSDSQGNLFESVSCASATRCVAVGGAGSKLLVERWNGTGWTRMSTPAISGYAYLSDVSCGSVTDCLAIGLIETTSSSQVFALVYDGKSWQRHTFTQPGARLDNVSCTATQCLAVGAQSTTSQQQPPLVVQYAGGKWKTVTLPTPGSFVTVYADVTCWSGSSCRAVGSLSNDGQSRQTLVAVHP